MRLLLAAAMLLALPASAHAAGTVTRTPSLITFQEDPAAAAGDDVDAGLDSGNIVLGVRLGVTSSDCTQVQPDRVDCPLAGALLVNLGGFGDTLNTADMPATIPVTANGGTGDDTFTDGPGNDTLNGGPGNDVWIAGLGGDVFLGGDGNDAVDYRARAAAVTITADGTADDGQAGEGDNVGADVEELSGGAGADVLVAGPNASRLHGGPGNDYLRGGPQEDRLEGEEGDDTIDSRDGRYDSVDCGPGNDVVYADPGDTTDNCEVAPDRDGDGYLNAADCAPDNPAVHPGAGEIVGNDVDEDCSGGPAYFTVEAGLTFSFAKKRHPSRIRFATLKLNSLEKGDKIALKCSGKGCPFKAKSLTASSAKLDLASRLKQRFLRSGATLEVRVTRAQYNGKVFRLKITRKPAVSQAKLCVGPHSTTPGACT